MASSTTLRFEFKIQGQSADLIRVHEFTLDEALSECFSLHLQGGTEDDGLQYDGLIGKPATLTVEGEDFTVTHHGMVEKFVQHPDDSGDFGKESYPIELWMAPRFKLLAYSGQNRIFQKKSTQDIVTEVLEAHGLKGDDLRFDLRNAPAEREYTVQYNETDFNFVSRLLEEEGIFYFFDHEGKKDVVVFGDHVDAVRPLPHTPALEYHPQAGLSHLVKDHITRVRREQRLVTRGAQVTDYNDRTPRTASIRGSSAGAAGAGEMQTFAPHVVDPAAASTYAGVAADGFQAERVALHGEGIARAMRPGYRFELDDGNHSPFEGKYTVTRVSHRGDQREGFEGDKARLIYSNSFACIPAATQFRPPPRAFWPKVPGVILARVDGKEGDYAYLDEEGRYRAKLPFDLSDLKDGQATLPIRLSQPYAGSNYGTHFPLHNGNDLVLSFLNGDIDRPIALGAIPNPSNPSPVTSRNKSESVVKTASGHILRMDDLKDKTAVDLTSSGKHQVSLNDDKDHKEIRLKSTDGNEMAFDDTNKNIRIRTTDGGHQILMDNKGTILTLQTKYGHLITLDDAKKALSIQTKDGHLLKISDEDKLIALQDKDGKHSLQIDIGGSKVLITTDGDMALKAKGKLDVQAKEINLEAKQGAINLKAMKDVALQGMNVTGKGQQKVAFEGTVEASLKGLNTKIEAQVNLDLKAGVQAKLAGAMANLEGQAMSQVKGAVVMIN